MSLYITKRTILNLSACKYEQPMSRASTYALPHSRSINLRYKFDLPSSNFQDRVTILLSHFAISVLMDFMIRSGYNHVYPLFAMLFYLTGLVFATQVVAPVFEDAPSKIPCQEQNSQFVRRMYHGCMLVLALIRAIC